MTDIHGVRTLLICDDEPEVLDLLKKRLSGLGDKIVVAPKPLDALNIIKEGEIDAVFCDISMPEMSGLELLTAVRGQGFRVPFIFLSGYETADKIREALQLGAMDFLTKPINGKELVDIAIRALEIGVKERQIAHELLALTQNENSKVSESVTHILKMKRQVSLLRVTHTKKRKCESET